jgi:hypothetical protein
MIRGVWFDTDPAAPRRDWSDAWRRSLKRVAPRRDQPAGTSAASDIHTGATSSP